MCFGKTLNWQKLSNSGDTLKLMVPSCSRKAISGWNNYPGMVTSHEMNENEMGYRGSKSVTNLNVILTILTIFAVLNFAALESTNEFCFIQAVAPVLFYDNADKDKINILKENNSKSGVYRWVHKDSGKCYVGSSINLGKRISYYYNINSLMKNKRIISSALLKYGYSDFSFEILEYCDPANCLEREQYYIDLFDPEYNILKLRVQV